MTIEPSWWRTARGRFVLVGGSALVLFTTLAIVRGTPEDITWYLAHVGGFIALSLVASTRLGSRVAGTALIAYAIALPTLTLLVGFTPLDPWNDPVRLQLFTDNPNLLAADLVAVFVAASVLRPRWTWALWLVAVAVAVVLTGSRTALLALAAAVAVWVLLPRVRLVERATLVGSVGLAGIFIGAAMWQVQREAQLPNLIRVSTTFDTRDWTTYGDSLVEVTPRVAEGPWPGTRADRVRAETTSSRLTLYQSLGRSVTGTTYVASVYLRADAPQTVVLSNHLARVRCEVTSTWTRCVTPPGEGNDRSAIQFRFEVQEPGDVFDVYAFGPQYEVGTEATAYQPRTGGIVPRVVINRFGNQSLSSLDGLIREAQNAAAVAAASAAPLTGAGIAWTDRSDTANGQITHAHNVALERLAADGVFGTAVWVALLGSVAVLLLRAFGARAVSIAIAVAMLNTFDYTLLHSGTFFAGAALAGRAMERIDSHSD